MSIKDRVAGIKKTQVVLGNLSSQLKNEALAEISRELKKRSSEIVRANKKDTDRSVQEGLPSPLLKRLKFDERKIADVCEGIESLIRLPDPVGKTLNARELDKGLELYQVSCPIGVIGMIFESRPDALVQIATLCLKSGNGVILKGGSEALETNKVLTDIIHTASVDAGLPEGWISLAGTRKDVMEMLELDDSIDLLIPRGSNSFVRYIMENTSIPVLGHADGICHLFIDKDADVSMAVELTDDSKTQYVAVCNALETLLVDAGIAEDFLPILKKRMDEKHVELRGCERTKKIINVDDAVEQDWKTEYLDYILSIKIVNSLEEAISHINTYGSGHTDGIVTADKEKALTFMNSVDSADVFWNASTRFADGYRFGLGAEVGISTNKIHARGPVGLEGLVIYKWKLIGNGHKVADYSGTNCRTYTHKELHKDYAKL